MSESISAYLPSQPGNGPSVVVHDGRRFWQLVVGVKKEQEFFVMRFFGTHVCVRLTPRFRRVVGESPRVVALVALVMRTNFYFEVMVTCVRVACFAVTNLRIAVRCKFNFLASKCDWPTLRSKCSARCCCKERIGPELATTTERRDSLLGRQI